MSISLRIRSFDENQSSEAVREAARERWTETLASWPGVLSSVSRRRAEVQPVDLTIVMESGNHADALFGSSELVANLNGLVAGAHAVHVVGGPAQVNGTPLEVPS